MSVKNKQLTTSGVVNKNKCTYKDVQMMYRLGIDGRQITTRAMTSYSVYYMQLSLSMTVVTDYYIHILFALWLLAEYYLLQFCLEIYWAFVILKKMLFKKITAHKSQLKSESSRMQKINSKSIQFIDLRVYIWLTTSVFQIINQFEY